jgi:ABC-type transport system involved in cytochrome c biogenesis permease subunit
VDALLLQLTAAVYLAAGLLAGSALGVHNASLSRAAASALGVGVLLHGLTFTALHSVDSTPPLTDGPTAVSFMAWIGTLTYLGLLWRYRLIGLVALIAPLSFLGVFYAALSPAAIASPDVGDGSLAHAHVLLASAGLALLGIAGVAGAAFLAEHHRLKRKRHLEAPAPWPSLEALDRVNALALAVGFPLLTLGVVTGAMWVRAIHGAVWMGTAHETWCLVAWVIYAVLVTLRFGAGQGARRSALTALGGFAFAGFAVIGVELLL